MPLDIAQHIADAVEAYALTGLAFALVFLPFGVTRVDPRVAGAPKTLRLLLLPGVAALWPLFVWRWMAGGSEPLERNPHRVRAR